MNGPQTSKRVQHLFFVLSDTEHDTSFGDTDAFLLRLLEDLETLPEGGPPVSDERREGLHSLNVVRVDVQAGFSNQ